jgi:SAM-dependent methyltransferase
MRELGISCLSGDQRPGLLSRLRGAPTVGLGDIQKSWDVLRTAEFLEARLSRAASILDLGAFNSEILGILRKMGFGNLTGIDLDPSVSEVLGSMGIATRVGDFYASPFPAASFDAVTAISVIEHGFRPGALLAEMARVVRPGGWFVSSFDYWPEKISTAGKQVFGIDWRIFSREEVLDFLAEARSAGFLHEGSVDLDAGQPTIRWEGKAYTFAWLALQRGAAR